MPPDCALLVQWAIAHRRPPPWEMQKPPRCAHLEQPSILQKCRPPCSMQRPLRRAAFTQCSRRHLVVGLADDEPEVEVDVRMDNGREEMDARGVGTATDASEL